jgi:Holliday junction resolvasome RuvABC DNA-binding subunit
LQKLDWHRKAGQELDREETSYLTTEKGDIVSEVTNLGYSRAQANRALGELPKSRDLSLDDRVKLALLWLARH